ncbi:ATP-binding cassette domain-containing protein, partial [Lactobacillus hominis]
MLQVENLNKSFSDKQVLFDVSFTVNNGQIMGLVGKNGSGKTTLFHSILKFVKYKGSITINDMNPEIRTRISRFLFMAKLSKQDKIGIYN